MITFIPTARPTGRCFASRSRTLWEGPLSSAYNSIAAISKEEVQAFYEEFLRALKSGDITALERIYADDYLLVRPNGDTLEKKEILADLRHHFMRFTSFEVNDALIRTKGSVGILTAAVRSTAVRDGIEIKTNTAQRDTLCHGTH